MLLFGEAGGLRPTNMTVSADMCRFEIVNGGIEHDEGAITQDRPILRTRTRLILDTEIAKTRTNESGSNQGRNALNNRPYEPLGSMESVLHLQIRRKRQTEVISPNIGKGSHAGNQSSSNSGTSNKVNSNSNNHNSNETGDLSNKHERRRTHGGSRASAGTARRKSKERLSSQASEEDEEGRKSPQDGDLDLSIVPYDQDTMTSRLWALRYGPMSNNNSRHGSHTLGYDVILQKLKEVNHRITVVRAGGSLLGSSKRHDPIDCAKFASSRAERRSEFSLSTDGVSVGSQQDSRLPESPSTSTTLIQPNMKANGKRDSAIVPLRPPGSSSSTRVSQHRMSLMGGKRASVRGGKLLNKTPLTVVERLQEGLSAIAQSSELGNHKNQHSPQKSNAQDRGESATGYPPSRRSRRNSISSAGSDNQGRSPGDDKSTSAATDAADKLLGPRLSTYSKEVMDNAKVLGEYQRRRLPSYVLHFPRKGQNEKTKDILAELRARQLNETIGEHNAGYGRSDYTRSHPSTGVMGERDRDPGTNTRPDESGHLHLSQDQAALKRLKRLEEQHERILKRIQKSALQSRKLQDTIVDRCHEFFETKRHQQSILLDRMTEADFERANEVRRKFISLDLALHPAQVLKKSAQRSQYATSQMDTQKQLDEIRRTAKELRSLQAKHNLENSVWFKTLLASRSESSSTPLSLAEQKLLAALRKLIIEGYPLSKEVFYGVLLDVMDRRDHFLAPFQRLVTAIRVNVLKIDPVEYLEFLEANKLHVPKTLLDSIETVKKIEAKTGDLNAGMRAAALAMRWKIRTKRKGSNGSISSRFSRRSSSLSSEVEI